MSEVEPQKPPATGWRQFLSQRRFTILLVILVLLLAGPSVLFGFGLSVAWFDALMSLLMLFAILSLCFERRQRFFVLVLGIPTIIFSLSGHAFSGSLSSTLLLVVHFCEVLFLVGAAVLTVRTLFTAHSLTFDSVLGAVCGYMFLGVAWGVLYSMIERFHPGSFHFSPALIPETEPSAGLMQVLTYYSFITLSTVGYGDVSPVSPTTRTLAWIEAIGGQFYLAVIVAGLVSMLLSKPTHPQQ
jgi:hypothetical protein